MELLFRDLRYGVRLLLKDKAFTLTALATLAICIGANVAVFTVVNGVLLGPLPAPRVRPYPPPSQQLSKGGC